MEVLTTQFTFVTDIQDQGKALDAAVAFGLKQGWEMITIIWSHQDEEQKHHFTISYNKNLKTE